MAIRQEIVDRYKAEGFYRHIEWERRRGILVKIYNKNKGDVKQTLSFESGTFDIEYDQTFPEYRQFFLTRRDFVKFLVNMNISTAEIARIFRMIDGAQTVFKHV